MTVRILQGDCREVLRTLPDASVHCCVTSPPYFGLRSYGIGAENGEIGLEPSPEEYVAEMVTVFREVWRVMRDDGTLWLNLGDSYAVQGGKGAQGSTSQRLGRKNVLSQEHHCNRAPPPGFKAKDLMMIPSQVALALRASGWYLRSDIIWAKKNCMPESVTDRPSQAHEHVFLLTKRPKYFYDAEAIREEGVIPAGTRAAKGSNVRSDLKDVNGRPPEYWDYTGTRNSRNVWSIATQPFPDAHFATFPPELAERCIKAGTSEKGCCAACGAPWAREVQRTRIFESGSGRSGNKPNGKGAGGAQTDSGSYDVRMGAVLTSSTTGWSPTCQCAAPVIPCTILDCFAGAFTSLMVADRLQRHGIGIELNAEYCAMAERRIHKDAGLFADLDMTRATDAADASGRRER